MEDYDNHRKWVQVELKTESVHLQDSMTPEELFDISKNVIATGYEKGLQNCSVRIESSYEAWEDFLGDPCMFPVGYREYNEAEKKSMLFDDRVNELALSKNITPYQARKVLELHEEGIISGDISSMVIDRN